LNQIIEDQRGLLAKNEEIIRNDQRDKNELKETLFYQESQISGLKAALEKHLGTSENYLDEIKTRAEENSKYKIKIERLTEEVEEHRREAQRNKALYTEAIQELETSKHQLSEYIEREQLIRELYNRHQQSKDEMQGLIHEKEKTIQYLQNKLLELETERSQEDRSRINLIDEKNLRIKVYLNLIYK
jgi:hypothetical protein